MRLKQIGSAGNKTRRYHERPNETSNTEVKETMKVAITAKRVVILMMTMALAVAMVACSAAAGKPGPAGPQGEQGAPGTPAEPGDTTTTPGGPVPVQVIKDTAPIVFNDDDKGKASTASEDVMLADYFYPSTGLTFMLDGDPPKPVNAEVMGDVLTVSIKSDADYMTHMVKVKASNEIDSEPIEFAVRRNQPPMIAMYTGASAAIAPAMGPKSAISVWVGSKATELKIVDLAKSGATCMASMMDCIPVYLKGKPADVTQASIGEASDDEAMKAMEDVRAFFYDDLGNSLKLVPEALNTSKAAMLDVMGGGKVTLMGLKSTWDPAAVDSPEVTDEKSIMVDFTAQDDNGMSSLDAHVITVMVDLAPSTKGAIGTRVIKASGKMDADRMVMVADVGKYFKDDRLPRVRDADDPPGLMYYAWSDNPDVALVEGNPENVMKANSDTMVDLIAGSDTSGSADDFFPITITAVNPGEAMITVRVMEPKADGTVLAILPASGTIAHGALGQSVDQTFKVVVQLS